MALSRRSFATAFNASVCTAGRQRFPFAMSATAKTTSAWSSSSSDRACRSGSAADSTRPRKRRFNRQSCLRGTHARAAIAGGHASLRPRGVTLRGGLRDRRDRSQSVGEYHDALTVRSRLRDDRDARMSLNQCAARDRGPVTDLDHASRGRAGPFRFLIHG